MLMFRSPIDRRPTTVTGAGRRTLLAPAIAEGVAVRVRKGASPRQALIATGVSPNTCYEWLARGRGTHTRKAAIEPYTTFVEAIDQAEEVARAG